MPKITKVQTVEITPQQFVSSCTYGELIELQLEVDSAIGRIENIAGIEVVEEEEISVKSKNLNPKKTHSNKTVGVTKTI